MATRKITDPVEFITNYKDKHPKATVQVLRAQLIANGHAEGDKAANAILQSCGLGGKRGRKGFRDTLYARLIEGPLSADEFNTMIADQSDNTKAHIKHYWAIVELANTVRETVKAPEKAA